MLDEVGVSPWDPFFGGTGHGQSRAGRYWHIQLELLQCVPDSSIHLCYLPSVTRQNAFSSHKEMEIPAGACSFCTGGAVFQDRIMKSSGGLWVVKGSSAGGAAAILWIKSICKYVFLDSIVIPQACLKAGFYGCGFKSWPAFSAPWSLAKATAAHGRHWASVHTCAHPWRTTWHTPRPLCLWREHSVTQSLEDEEEEENKWVLKILRRKSPKLLAQRKSFKWKEIAIDKIKLAGSKMLKF